MLPVFSSLNIIDLISNPEIIYWQVQVWAPIFNMRDCTKLPCCWLEWLSIFSQSRQHKHTCSASRIMSYALNSHESLVVCHSSLQRQVKVQSGKAQPMDTTGWQSVPKSNQTCPYPWACTIVVPSVLEVRLSALSFLPFSPTSHFTSVLQSSAIALSPRLCILLSACDTSFSPTGNAFQCVSLVLKYIQVSKLHWLKNM